MTWYDRHSVTSARPAVFAERARSANARPCWVVLPPNESVSDSGVFPLRSHGETDSHQNASHEQPPAKRPTLRPVPSDVAQQRDADTVNVAAPPLAPPLPAGFDPSAVEALERAITDFAQVRARVLKQSEAQIVALASKIARRVISREISEDPLILLTLASEGIESLVSRDQTTIRIGAWMDDNTFESIRARLQAQCPGCRVVQDPDLGVGGCVVETDMGKVDESVDTRLANVLSVLLPDGDARIL